jgi:micrococcal nuclease
MVHQKRSCYSRTCLFSVIAFAVLFLISCSSQDQRLSVRDVVDGDTIVLSSGESIRLIGIDAPEKLSKYDRESTAMLKKLLEYGELSLTYDKQKYDRYGRTLAYVYSDTLFVNKAMLDSGLAVVYFLQPNTRCFSEFVTAQKRARENGLNIWSEPITDREPYYLATQSSFRFHRPDCASVKGRDQFELRKFSTREEALDSGLSPCRNCRP